MKKLNEPTWIKVRVFSKENQIIIYTTNSSIDAIRLITDKDTTVPYVTRTATNNGISQFVSIRNYDMGSDDSGCITVGLDTQTAFYQPYKFVTGQNIQIITSERFNRYSALFFTTILKNQMFAKFNWGGNGATLGRMKQLEALVPVDKSNKPDYQYMADYSKAKEESMLDRYKAFAEKELSKLEYKEIPTLDEKEWKNYLMPFVFERIKRGKRLKKADHIKGLIPYVSSTGNNNGVDGYIEASQGTRSFNNCISLANSGSVGKAFYEPFTFVASDHVTSLKTDGFSKYLYLFICSAIEKQSCNFNFNREINEPRIKKMQIMLPSTNEGSPDYEYMEQYAKNLMYKKYNQYLSYQKQKAVNT